MNRYKDQFTEWSTAYPVFVHQNPKRKYAQQEYLDFEDLKNSSKQATIRTHHLTIKAIKKAMKL